MNIEGKDSDCALPKKLYTSDKWILNRFNNVTAAVTENLEKFELGMAVSKLYDFIWDDFCDWYIELSKPALYGEERPPCPCLDDEQHLKAPAPVYAVHHGRNLADAAA